jgi:hypothetical protein
MNQEEADRREVADVHALFDELQQQLLPALREARAHFVVNEIQQIFEQLNAGMAAVIGNVVENYVYSG